MAGINYNPTPYYYGGYNVGVTGSPAVTGTLGVTNVPTGTPNATMGAPTGTVDAFENMNWLATMNKVTISNNVTGTPNASIGAPTATPTATAVAPTGTQAVNTSGSKRTLYINTNPTLEQTQTPGAPGSCPTPTPEPTIGAPTGTPTPTIGAPTGTPTVSIIPGLTPLPKGCGDGNPGLLDTNALFSGTNGLIDAKFMMDNLQLWENSNYSGLSQLSNMIQKSLKDMELTHRFDVKEYLDCMIKSINDYLGIENTNPPSLSLDAIRQLNRVDALDKISMILKSSELTRDYYLNIDGEIGDFGQANTPDCMLLADIISLCSSEQGCQIIKDAIKDNGDDTYTVSFKALDWECIITADEIVKAKQSDLFVYGDADVVLLELAFEKYKEAFSDSSSSDFFEAFTGFAEIGFNGLINEKLFKYKSDDINNGNLVLLCNFPNGASVTDIEGNTVNFIYNHQYSITDVHIDENDPSKSTVTIINPWNSDEPIILSWDEFNKTNPQMSYFQNLESIKIEDLFVPLLNDDITYSECAITVANLIRLGAFNLEDIQAIIGAEDNPQIVDKMTTVLAYVEIFYLK